MIEVLYESMNKTKEVKSAEGSDHSSSDSAHEKEMIDLGAKDEACRLRSDGLKMDAMRFALCC